MSDFRFVEKLASSPWLCDQDHVEFLHGVFVRYLDRAASGRSLDVEAVEKEYGVNLENTRQVTVKNGVARIPVEGTIMRRASLFTAMSGGVSTEAIMTDFHAAHDNPNVRSILFVFDTPGGEAHGINELAAAIREKRDLGEKRIESYVDGLCCSAGYWLASATSSITTDAMGALGSIGVVTTVRNPRAAGEPDSLEFVSSRSPLKRPDPHTEEGRGAIQGYVDDLGDEFIRTVADNRGVDVETVEKDFGQGWVLTGRRAVAAGLADALGTEEEALEALRNRAGARPLRVAAFANPRRVAAVHAPEPMLAWTNPKRNAAVAARTTNKEATIMLEDIETRNPAAAQDPREAWGRRARRGGAWGTPGGGGAAPAAEPPAQNDPRPAEEPNEGSDEDAGEGAEEGADEEADEPEQQSTDDGGESDPSGESEETENDQREETDDAMTEARTSGAQARTTDERSTATTTTLSNDERAELARLRAKEETDQADSARLTAALRKHGISAMLDARAGNIDLGDGKRGAMPKAQRDAAEDLIEQLASAGTDPIVLSDDGTATLADSTAGKALGSLLTHWKPQELGERGTQEGEAQTEGPQGDHERVLAELERRELGMEHYGAVAGELAANGEIRKER